MFSANSRDLSKAVAFLGLHFLPVVPDVPLEESVAFVQILSYWEDGAGDCPPRPLKSPCGLSSPRSGDL